MIEANIGGIGRPLIGKVKMPRGADFKIKDWNHRHESLFRVGAPGDEEHAGDLGHYAFGINDDGTFRLEDVPAGDYRMEIIAYSIEHHREIGRVKEQFYVPEMKNGRSDEPFDLGTLEIGLE